MARNMKGQFYVISGFMIVAYLYFLIQLFTAVQTNAEVPRIDTGDDIKETLQAIADEGETGIVQKINIMEGALGLRSESIYLKCYSYADQTERCDLPFSHWACGMNVTIASSTHGKGKIQLDEFIQSNYDFWKNTSRAAMFVEGNTTRNLEKITLTAPFRGVLYDGHRLIRSSWSGNSVSFRLNVREVPKHLYLYDLGSSAITLFEDIGILNEGSYDASQLYKQMEAESPQNLSFSDLENLWGNTGPSVLFVPSGNYPTSYGSELLEYVKYGGILVSPYGLCNITSLSCLTGDISELTQEHGLQGVGDWSSLEDTNSLYFTSQAAAWMASNTTPTVNESSVGLGAVPYEEGWVIFVGNESMLSLWSDLSEFLSLMLEWALPETDITKKSCLVQNA
ncbi:MAG: hypothetical protein GOV00_00920 [Candidatus Altiarchaeota archaeon]|nr:hypothetical protein [Candidatus Altiarchaeota archaeon]